MYVISNPDSSQFIAPVCCLRYEVLHTNMFLSLMKVNAIEFVSPPYILYVYPRLEIEAKAQ